MKRCFALLVLAAILVSSATLAVASPTWRLPEPVKPITGGLPILPMRGGTTPGFDAEAVRGAQFVGPAQLGRMSIDVVMQLRDERSLRRYARLVNDRHSLYYRHFLTPQQLGDDFGATPAEYQRAMEYFWAQGLLVRAWNQRQVLRVVGPQANVERALSTHFGWFRKHGINFYAPITTPRFTTPLSVRAIGGIVNYHRMRRHIVVSGPFYPAIGLGPGFIVGSSPFDLAAAFDYTGAYSINPGCCLGDGITIGIVGTGPISSADVPFFRSLFNVSGIGTVNQVNATDAIFGAGSLVACCYSTGLTTPPAVTAPCFGSLPGCNPEDLEAQLDTEQTSSLAPDASVNFYLAYNPNECFTGGPCAPGAGTHQLGIGETDDELQQIINDNVADVVSGSYGIGELDFAGQSGGLLNADGSGVEPNIFAALATEGIAVFMSSGDTGAEGCQRDGILSTADVLCVSYPAGDPNVTSVGGTTTPIGNNGRLTGLVTAWGVQTQSGGAGGGGFSQVFTRPGFEPTGQFCANMADSSGFRCDRTHRLQPDVSLNADPVTGTTITINCGTGPGCAGLGGAQIGAEGGTSASAPDMAAMWALVLEACKLTPSCATASGAHPYRLGNAAPLLYGLSQSARAAAFLDITYGNVAVPLSSSGGDYTQLDPGFLASPGYDLATGLGAPFARNLIKAITGM